MALPALAAAAVTASWSAPCTTAPLRTTVVPTPGRSARCSASASWRSSSSLCSSWPCVRRRCRWPRSAWRLSCSAPGVVARRALRPAPPLQVLGLPVLVGLFGLAVALGTLGRSWSGPATLLSHLDAWGTAAVAALTSVLVNNLPAASLLAARQPPHPFALLIGLNVGPNLFVTGSLAWILWLRAARSAGGRPDVGRASLLGLASVPLAMAAAVGVLVLSGAS